MNMRAVQLLRVRAFPASAISCLLIFAAFVAGCGGGSDGSGNASPGTAVSAQIVSGVAATGSPLVGQVILRDSSSARKDKVTVIANDGSFSIDVADMKAPYILKATGTADGASRTLYSFADRAGIANINPLTHAALANAAGVDDPAVLFDTLEPATLDKAGSRMQGSIATLRAKLQPLLEEFGARTRDPLRQRFVADHDGLDGMFDNVRIVLSNGILTITNVTSGAVIFSARVRDLENGKFTEDRDHLPKRVPRLAAPTGVTAVGGDGQVTLSWAPVANATSYDVFYKSETKVAESGDDREDEEDDDEDDDGKWVRNVTSPFVLSGLASSTTYSFMVRARDNHRKGRPSAKVSATTTGATPAPTVPAAPAAVTATGGTRQATISWPAVTGATSYNLYWSVSTGVTTANGTKVSGVARPAVLTGLADGTTYYFIVTAVNSAGESPASVQVAATTLAAVPPPATVPSAPSGVGATGGTEQVTVTWPAVTGATSYNVYWSTSSGVTTATGTRIAGVSSPYVHAGRTASTAYFYIVTAVNSAGESSASAEATATTSAPPLVVPAAPTGVAAVGGQQLVSVSWNPVSGATSYNLYWSATLGVTVATGTKIAGVTSPYPHAGRADGTAYFYIVTAVNSVGESVASSQATATTTAAPPPPIDGVALYNQHCSRCHNALPGEKQGASATDIQNAIANFTSMRDGIIVTNGTALTLEQIQAISAAMQ